MQPQIVHESEVHRQHVRLKIPIQVEIDGVRYQVDDAFLLWTEDGRPLAVGLAEDNVLRTAVSPGHDRSPELAEALAEVMTGFEYVDALGGTAVRALLLDRGWSVDPDPWVLLHRDLRQDDDHHDPDTRTLDREDDVAARTAVQRSAFAPGSTNHKSELETLP